MAVWNNYLDRIQFRVIRDSTAATGLGNGVNNVFWSNTIYGRSFDQFAGYTMWLSRGGSIYEADVIMNNQSSWNSYRGNRRNGVIDFRRLVMHEFGHVLGAGHDRSGLMAPVYNAAGARCIDYEAVSLVAQAQQQHGKACLVDR